MNRYFNRTGTIAAAVVAAALAMPGAAVAADIMPDFTNAPVGWTTDRYQPDFFGNVGTFQGRNNVLGIGISTDDSLPNRPSGFQTPFRNTQGMKHAVNGGIGDTLIADLYIPTSWSDPTQGARRTDMWGVMVDGTSTITGYPIMGFSNNTLEDGYVGFRAWTSAGGGAWTNLAAATVNYDDWNTLAFGFDGTNYTFAVNGTTVLTTAADPGTVGILDVIMQAYNFGDPAFANSIVPVVENDYVAHWANASAVPEPGTLAIVALGLAGLGVMRRRQRA